MVNDASVQTNASEAAEATGLFCARHAIKSGKEAMLSEYVLVITEKPDAARRIAAALNTQSETERIVDDGVPYYVVQRDSRILVFPALGHLYTVTGVEDHSGTYPVFDVCWVPRYMAERGQRQNRKWLEVASRLAANAKEFVDACDYDVEGSLVGYCILKYACGGKEKEAKRMKYSTLTRQELVESYEKRLPHLNFHQIESGLARHEVDWLYGVNLSRALTDAARSATGKYMMLSTGRVQGPTLRFLASREIRVKSFVPTPYWTLKATFKVGNSVCEAMHSTRLQTKKEAERLSALCKGNATVKNVRLKKTYQPPPAPFNLGILQTEAYRLFGLTPMQTLNIAQRLYLDALISYPRTDSQKLPATIGFKNILSHLSHSIDFGEPARELLEKETLTPMQGRKEDSAHPAIYPTGNLPEKPLRSAERDIWILITKRFMSAFGEPAVRLSVEIEIDAHGVEFCLKGVETLVEGWTRFYKPFVQFEDKLLPQLEKGQKVEVEHVTIGKEFTKPPPRYTPASLLKKMEREGIGTKTTRAGIIQTLYDRKYIQGERISVTDLGFTVLTVLMKNCPAIVSVSLTRQIEEAVEKIQEEIETHDNVVKGATEALRPVIATLKEKKALIGKELSQAIMNARLTEKAVGTCPLCMEGKLIILTSKKTGKRFVGCTNYFKQKCRNASPLPQRGFVKPTQKKCRACGWPTVRVYQGKRRVWTLCLNPECPAKEGKKSNALPNLQ